MLARRLGAIGFLALAVAACGIVQPANRVDLRGTQWSVANIGSSVVGHGVTVAFGSGPETFLATLETPCGIYELAYAQNSGGDLIQFAFPESKVERDCADRDRKTTDSVIDAFITAIQVDAENHDELRLVGTQDIGLHRIAEQVDD